jgi:hypothetical protein
MLCAKYVRGVLLVIHLTPFSHHGNQRGLARMIHRVDIGSCHLAVVIVSNRSCYSRQGQKANTTSRNGGEHTDPKATKKTKTTLSRTQKNKAQPTHGRCTVSRTLNQGIECPPQAIRTASVSISAQEQSNQSKCMILELLQ